MTQKQWSGVPSKDAEEKTNKKRFVSQVENKKMKLNITANVKSI